MELSASEDMMLITNYVTFVVQTLGDIEMEAVGFGITIFVVVRTGAGGRGEDSVESHSEDDD